MNRTPEAASVPMRSITTLKAGNMNGVTAPLRANSSHATANAATGSTRTKAQPIAVPYRTAEKCSDAAGLLLPCKHPISNELIDAICCKAQECDRENDGEHRIVAGVGTEKPNQVAQTFPGNDQFRRNKQNE